MQHMDRISGDVWILINKDIRCKKLKLEAGIMIGYKQKLVLKGETKKKEITKFGNGFRNGSMAGDKEGTRIRKFDEDTVKSATGCKKNEKKILCPRA